MLNNLHRFHLFSLLIICLAASSAEADRVGGEFELTTHQNSPYSLANSRGQVVLLFFGFTSCPDVCPHTLSVVQSVLSQLGSKAQQVQPLFITVDPNRDTPEILKHYLEYFGSRYIGLTGSVEEIDKVVGQFSAFYSFEGNTAEGAYSVNHTSNLYIIDTEGEVASIVPYGTPMQAILRSIEELLLSKS